MYLTSLHSATDLIKAIHCIYFPTGIGFGEVAIGGLHNQDRGVDGAAKENADLPVGIVAAIFIGIRRKYSAGGSPVEPTWVRGR